MKKLRRIWIVAMILAVIVGIEGLIVFYDIVRPNPENFKLATMELDVPAREVKVEPFVFEDNSIKNMLADLDNLKSQMTDSLLKTIIRQSEENAEAAQKEPQPQNDEDKAVENTAAESAARSAVQSEKKTEKVSADQKPKQLSQAAAGGPVMVAVVIDDMGVSVPHTRDILSLEKPITASFLTYGAANRKQVKEAKEKGFEVMLHVPMMPHAKADLAPVTLSPDMQEDEIKNDFEQMLDRYKGLGMKGINNHMGSLFTEDEKSLGYVMQILKDRNLFFLDSKTTAKSVGAKVAAEYGVPYIARDVFLDNENDYNYIMGQLRQTEKIAHMRGYAVAIGHPRSQTYLALRDWMKELPERRIRLVRLGDLVRDVNKKAEN
ncbi:MAG: divergent polysaccharide deacetylase family protein [Alphaproteobacteria bacterium]|nr:divergent polysaccharide deacetylase family protein [Alphaproteobacteria bacterium]MDY4690177.1 divergent polysaccharide deacetylase family protein [Alphaproteobacteria bacterium]